MRMHIKKGTNFGQMIAVVKDCQGEVFLKSDQGDWLIECTEPQDYEALSPFLTQDLA